MTFWHSLLHIFGWMFIGSLLVLGGLALGMWLMNRPENWGLWK